MAGTAAGMAKATAARMAKRAAARAAQPIPARSMYRADFIRAIEQTIQAPAQTNEANDNVDGERTNSGTNVVTLQQTGSNVAQTQQLVASVQPLAVVELVKIGFGRGKGIPWAVRRAALTDLLTAGGTLGANSSKPTSDEPTDLDSASLSAFVEAGHRALTLRAQAASAQDAEIVSDSSETPSQVIDV